VIADPPLLAGAVNATDAWVLPGVATGEVGAPGTVAGVTAEDAAEADPVPALLVAVTVKVYAVPLVRPLTMQFVVAPSGVVQVAPPGAAVAV
jgi:hypothetical protein